MSSWRPSRGSPRTTAAARAAQPATGPSRIRAQAGRLLENESSYYSDLLRKIETRGQIAASTAVLLEGSIAEGFGNPSSDIDLLCVCESGSPQRQLFFIDRRRIELMHRRLDDVHATCARVDSWLLTAPELFDEEDLHEYQQLCNAVPLREQGFLTDLRACFSRDRAAVVSQRFHQHRAVVAFDRAFMAYRIGRSEDALRYAKQAVVSAAKMLCARHGETYLAEKFLLFQLERSRAANELAPNLQAVLAARGPVDAALLAKCCELGRMCGLSKLDMACDAPSLTVRRVPQASVHHIAHRTYVAKSNRMYALDSSSSELCRAAGLLDHVGYRADVGRTPSEVWALIADLHDHGLVEIGLSSRRNGWMRLDSMPVPSLPPPWMTPAGPLLPDSVRVCRLPFTPGEFASCGAELNWAHILIDNCREDIIGAYEVDHWSVVEYALRLQAQLFARILLLGHAMIPVPDWPNMVQRLHQVPDLAVTLVERIEMLEVFVVSDATEADAGCALADTILERMHPSLGAAYLRGSHLEKGSYERTKDLCHAWLRLTQQTGAPSLIAPAESLQERSGPKPIRSGSVIAPRPWGSADKEVTFTGRWNGSCSVSYFALLINSPVRPEGADIDFF